MFRAPTHPIPERHPLRTVFRTLTERGLTQVRLSDADLVRYLSDMLVRFVHVDDWYALRDPRGKALEYLVDMLQWAEESGPGERGNAYRHIGDFSLFLLGFFPESLEGRRKSLGPDYYVEQGRRSYERAAEMVRGTPPAGLLHKLSDHFESCMLGLHWVREYSRDPFYQYVLRQFRIL